MDLISAIAEDGHCVAVLDQSTHAGRYVSYGATATFPFLAHGWRVAISAKGLLRVEGGVF